MPENLRCKQAVALAEKPFVISGLMFRSPQSKALGAPHVFIYNRLLFVFKLLLFWLEVRDLKCISLKVEAIFFLSIGDWRLFCNPSKGRFCCELMCRGLSRGSWGLCVLSCLHGIRLGRKSFALKQRVCLQISKPICAWSLRTHIQNWATKIELLHDSRVVTNI